MNLYNFISQFTKNEDLITVKYSVSKTCYRCICRKEKSEFIRNNDKYEEFHNREVESIDVEDNTLVICIY